MNSSQIALDQIKKISKGSLDSFDFRAESIATQVLSKLQKDADALVNLSRNSVRDFNNDTRVLVEKAVQDYLEPHLEKIMLEFSQSLAIKVDGIFKNASEEFMKQTLISDKNLEIVQKNEQYIKETLRNMAAQHVAQEKIRRITEEEFVYMTKALSEQVQKYSALIELQGEVKDGEKLKSMRVERLLRKRKQLQEKYEVTLDKLRDIVEQLQIDSKKYEIGKNAILEYSNLIKQKNGMNVETEMQNIKMAEEACDLIKLSYQEKYAIFKRDKEEFLENIAKLKSTESLLVNTEAKDLVKNSPNGKVTEIIREVDTI